MLAGWEDLELMGWTAHVAHSCPRPCPHLDLDYTYILAGACIMYLHTALIQLHLESRKSYLLDVHLSTISRYGPSVFSDSFAILEAAIHTNRVQ